MPAVTTLGMGEPPLWQMSLRGLVLGGFDISRDEGGNETAPQIGTARTLGPECPARRPVWATPPGQRSWTGRTTGPAPGTLTSWSHSECPGQHSCSSRRSCRSARPRPCHSRPRSPQPPSLRTARGAGPGGRCWAGGQESRQCDLPPAPPARSPAPAHTPPTPPHATSMVLNQPPVLNQGSSRVYSDAIQCFFMIILETGSCKNREFKSSSSRLTGK